MKNKKSKLLAGLLATTAMLCGALGLTACFGNDDGGGGGSSQVGGGNGNVGGSGEQIGAHTHMDKDENGACDVCNAPLSLYINDLFLNKSDVELKTGESEKLIVRADTSASVSLNYYWNSRDKSVATVNNDGLVTAVGEGVTDIYVSIPALDRYTVSCTVYVSKNNVAVSGVSLDKTEITLADGEEETLIATVAPADASNKKLIWTTSNKGVVTVADGKITAQGAGTATVTVETQDGEFKATCKVTVRGFTFSLFHGDDDSKHYILTGIGTVADEEIVIPETFRGIPVKEIGMNAFKDCTNVKAVTLPESLTSIGGGAFSGCTKLTEISVPDGVEIIDDNAFAGCTELTRVTLPDTLTELGNDAFEDCGKLTYTERSNALYLGNETNPCVALFKAKGTDVSDCEINEKTKIIYCHAFDECAALTEIIIPDTVTQIGYAAFRNCSGLQKAVIGSKVKFIEHYAFNGCSELSDLTIGERVEEIGSWAFAGCKSLESIELPAGVKEINTYAFAGCSSAKSINIPLGVKRINDYTFSGCASLESVEIHENITSVSSGAFKGCASLESIVIPETVTSFGGGIFYGCTNLVSVQLNSKITKLAASRNGEGFFENCTSLASISIPDGVTEIEIDTFNGCTSLKSITVGAGNANYSSQDGVLYNKAKTSFVCVPKGIESVTVPDTVYNSVYLKLRAYYFSGCTNLKTLVLPAGMIHIENGAFKNCPIENLTIDAEGWYNSGGVSPDTLKTINIISGSSLSYDKFKNYVNLTSVTLPASLTDIYSNAFENCTALKEVHISDLAAWCSITFDNQYANPLYYAHTLYLNGKQITELEIPEGITVVKAYAFTGIDVKKAVLPEGVTSIGRMAFYNCSDLREVEVPESLAYIGDMVFDDCKLLTYNTYDNALYLGNESNPYVLLMQAKNSSVTSCDINKKTRVIYAVAFGSCRNLEEVTVPDSIVYIGVNPYSSGKLQYNEYDNGLYLGNSANPYVILVKAKNTAITSVNIHSDTKAIISYAFYKCNSLTSVTIPDGVKSVSKYAFGWCEGLKEVIISDGTFVEAFAFVACNIEGLTAPVSALPSLELKRLEKVVITGGDTLIDGAFQSCKNLTEVTLPESITAIGTRAFSECDSLTSIVIPDNVTSIGIQAFNLCNSLSEVVIPAGVTFIGDWAFGNCASLKAITFKGTKAQWEAIEKDMLWAQGEQMTIHCTDGDITEI